MKKCPFGCHAIFDLPHFMFWCPLLDRVRKETGIYEYHNTSRIKWDLTDSEVIINYLWAMNDDPAVVKNRGNSLIQLRNKWYKLAIKHRISLGINIPSDVSKD